MRIAEAIGPEHLRSSERASFICVRPHNANNICQGQKFQCSLSFRATSEKILELALR